MVWTMTLICNMFDWERGNCVLEAHHEGGHDYVRQITS